jgi:nitroreductase
MTDNILPTIFSRRSIRRYAERPVEREVLTQLMQAAMAAPSATNSRPWEFVAVTQPETMAAFQREMPFGKFKAPAAVVVCGNHRIAKNVSSRLFWVQDCSAATENLLIAAAGLGLGTCWLGVHPMNPVEQIVRRIVKLPRHVTPLTVVYVGYPAEEKPARTQYEEERVHWEKYE